MKEEKAAALALSRQLREINLARFDFRESSPPISSATGRKLSEGALGGYYWILARQAKTPIGRQALQELHPALSGPSPDRQRMGRSGCRIRGLHIETKSAAFEVNTSSILLNDLSPPTKMTVVFVFSLSALAPGRK